MKTARITNDNWDVEANAQGISVKHSKRAGNDIEKIDFKTEEFLDFYNIIISIGQVHPEWLQ